MKNDIITCHDRSIKTSQPAPFTIITDLRKKEKRVRAASRRRAKTKYDFFEFCMTYFMANPDGSPRYMRRVTYVRGKDGNIRKVWDICPPSRFHKLSCDHALDENTLKVWARSHAKTTYEMKWAPMWEHICDPTGLGPFEEIHIVSPKNIKSAIEFIKYEFLGNDILKYDWNTEEIFNKSSRCNLTDTPEIVFDVGGRITSVSTKDQMRGMGTLYRPMVLRADDLLNPREARSLTMRKKAHDLIYSDAWLMIDPEGRRHICGTTMDPEDLISKGLASTGLFNFKMQAPAEFNDEHGKRTSNWPERWPLWRLDRERIRMEREWPGSYTQEMLLIPMRTVNALWSAEMLKTYTVAPPIQDMLIVTMVDLAYGKKEENSESAVMTWGGALRDIEGVCKRGDVFNLRADSGHYSEDEVIRIYLDHYKYFGQKGILGAEAKAWAEVFKNICERQAKSAGIRMPQIELVDPGGLDKRARAQPILYFWNEGRAFIREDDYETREQFLNFSGDPKERNDRVDGSVYCLGKFREREIGGSCWYTGEEAKSYVPEPVYHWSPTGGLHRPVMRPVDENLIPIEGYGHRPRRYSHAG